MFDVLHEFTSFTKTSDGASQDSLSSTFNFLGESFVLDLVYGINAVGPDGLPDLLWSGSLSRPLSPLSPFPVIPVRLFNVFDYNVGDTIGGDSATVTQGAGTLIEITGSGGIDGQRGVFGTVQYTADTLPNVLTQVQVNNALNNTAAPGAYDVAGAFQWDWELCSDPQHPQCPSGGGGGTGGFGGFGACGGGGGTATPEPSTGVLLMAASLLLARRKRA